MGTLRATLVGAISLVLLGGMGQLALALSDGEGNGGFTLKVIEELEEREWNWDRSPEGFAEISNMGVVALVEASDPRLSGTWADVLTCRATPEFNMCIGSVRVENDGGTWLGREESVHVERLPVGDGYQIFSVGCTVLEGQDGYEGLTAIVTSDEEKMEALPDVDGMGLIVDFGRPPQAELPAATD